MKEYHNREGAFFVVIIRKQNEKQLNRKFWENKKTKAKTKKCKRRLDK